MKLLTICQNPRDATSWYRGMGPLGYLRRTMPDLDFIAPSQVEWPTIHLCDAAFLQRPAQAEFLPLIESIKSFGLPIWMDYDDHLLCDPHDLPSTIRPNYGRKDQRDLLTQYLRMADVVTCSTEHLKAALAPYADDVRVIPNALPDEWEPDHAPTQKIAVWRGGATHDADLAPFVQDLGKLFRERTDWNLTTMGTEPRILTQHLEGCAHQHIDWAPHIWGYYRLLEHLRPHVNLFPLAANNFNRAKSANALHEAAVVGSYTVCPGWDGWEHPHAVHYTGPNFVEKVEQAMDAPACDALPEVPRISKANKARESILRELVV